MDFHTLTKTFIAYWLFLLLFLTNIKKVVSQCGGSPLTLTANSTVQYFTSPGYDTSYANDLTCEWLIDSGVPGQRVIVYSDYYDMDCAFLDTISIYDGSTDSSSALASGLCGTAVTSNTYVSSDQYVLVRFTSDGSNSGKGFEMVYISAAGTVDTACSSHVTLTANETPQYFTSPNFPEPYDSDTSCRWRITTPITPSVIYVDVLWQDIEEFIGCKYDKMSLYAGATICEETFIDDNCSKRNGITDPVKQFNSSTGNFLVLLTSDDSQQGNGFIIQYYATFPTTSSTTSTAATTTLAGATGVAGANSGSGCSCSSTETPTSDSNSSTDLNIPMMAGSAAAGAALAVLVMGMVFLIKRVKCVKAKTKKGVTTVKPIAQLPSRMTTVKTIGSKPPDPLHFV